MALHDTPAEPTPRPYYQEFYGYTGFRPDYPQYKTTPPADTKQHALADVGNSDSECSDAETMGKHRVQKPMSAKETTVYSQKKRIKGDTLIAKCQEWAQDAIRTAKKDVTLNEVKKGHVLIIRTDDWLAAAGLMVGKPSKDMLSGEFLEKISIRKKTLRLELRQTGHTERLYFPKDLLKRLTGTEPVKTDLSCKEIATTTTARLTAKNYTDAQYATWQLDHLKGDTGPKAKTDQQWLDCLNTWIFGVEASRNNATFVTGVMTLELIATGQMSYKDAFAENKYGGRFPMAVIDSGPGNMTARRKLIEHAQHGNPVGMKTDRRHPQWLAVPLKEAALIKNWLIHFKHADRSMSQKKILGNYETAVKALLETYFKEPA